MELVLILVGFVAGVVGMGSAIRRAAHYPTGRTAKIIRMIGGVS